MVKAKDFLECLCEELNYRFFAGFPCVGLDALYNNMSSKFMHYVPAVNEQIALDLSNGAFLAGQKAVVLIDANKIINLNLELNLNGELPILIIASSIIKPSIRKELYSIDLEDDIEKSLYKIDNYLENKRKPGILFVKEGLLK